MDIPMVPSTNAHHPVEHRELAYQVYSRLAAGDMRKALDLLADPQYPNIPEKTVYDWRSRYQWDRRMQLEKRAFGEELWKSWCQELSVAAPSAVRLMAQTVENEAAPLRERLSAAKFITSQYWQAAELLLRQDDAPSPVPDSLDSLTDAELLDYQAQLQNG